MRLIAPVLFVALAAGTARADESGWIMEDYKGALELGKKSGKLVQVDWTADWCGWCKKLEAETYSDADVKKYLDETFVNLRMDKDKNEELATKMNVEGIPALLFLDGDGRVVGRIVGFLPAAPYLKAVKEIQANGKKLVAAEEALKKDGKDLASHLAAGQVWAAADNWDEAEPHLKAVVDGDADNSKKLALEAWWEMGKHSAGANDVDGVKAAQEKLKGWDPENKAGHNDNLALAAGRLDAGEDMEKARGMFAEIVKAYPKSDAAAEAAFWLAALLADIDGDLDAAAKAFEQMAKDYPDSEWAARVPDILEQIQQMKDKKGE
ncbi:MAG: thioredoxin fold domain-containing protein [Planctomycetia bacterium]|nr:thioredoxin fold domain-containing protein [Planctomycetia bacterium]